METQFSSALLENAVTEISRLPGIGRKTALRLALHLLRRDEREAVALGQAIIDLRRGIRYCKVCHNISETEECAICGSPVRDHSTVCVVENVKDVITIEGTHEHRGRLPRAGRPHLPPLTAYLRPTLKSTASSAGSVKKMSRR